MCGRFVLAGGVDDYAIFLHAARIVGDPVEPSWNVAPTDPVLAAAEHHGERLLGTFRWGLVPHWSKARQPFHINARSETVHEKPAFRDALRYRRCLIPADGFYEWTVEDDGKQPHYIERDGGRFAFAGLWSRWTDPETQEELRTCTIVTTAAAPAIADIHDRMPLHLPEDVWDDWLDREETDPAHARAILESASVGPAFTHRTVSRSVNSIRNNDASLID
ncbi:MAG: SOS response-associated peptidase [Acidimicrobiia bacterium]|nr:SOS response-associated peptidase [Acidimicrobiia bacterium]